MIRLLRFEGAPASRCFDIRPPTNRSCVSPEAARSAGPTGAAAQVSRGEGERPLSSLELWRRVEKSILPAPTQCLFDILGSLVVDLEQDPTESHLHFHILQAEVGLLIYNSRLACRGIFGGRPWLEAVASSHGLCGIRSFIMLVSCLLETQAKKMN